MTTEPKSPMKIITYAKFQMTDVIGEYIPIAEESYEYEGPLALGCFGGASSSETAINQQQQQFMSTLQNNYTQQFGAQTPASQLTGKRAMS